MKTGVIAGCFDIIHPGYIRMFEEAKKNCDFLIVFLHSDPSVERPEKISPVLSISERTEILLAIKYVDKVYAYDTEKQLEHLLKTCKHDIRFLGSDYVGKSFTGDKSIPVHYISRSHGWSSTKLKKMIIEKGVHIP